jgi:hypothetical protein
MVGTGVVAVITSATRLTGGVAITSGSIEARVGSGTLFTVAGVMLLSASSTLSE